MGSCASGKLGIKRVKGGSNLDLPFYFSFFLKSRT
jgi:hypothetical protein